MWSFFESSVAVSNNGEICTFDVTYSCLFVLEAGIYFCYY